jgi:hypothetical protein
MGVESRYCSLVGQTIALRGLSPFARQPRRVLLFFRRVRFVPGVPSGLPGILARLLDRLP